MTVSSSTELQHPVPWCCDDHPCVVYRTPIGLLWEPTGPPWWLGGATKEPISEPALAQQLAVFQFVPPVSRPDLFFCPFLINRSRRLAELILSIFAACWLAAVAIYAMSAGMQITRRSHCTTPRRAPPPTAAAATPGLHGGPSFANMDWTGWLGSIMGMSSEPVAISGVSVPFPDPTVGKESRVGVPFTVLLCDIIQFDPSLFAGLDCISNAARTCNLTLGVGDGKVDTSTGDVASFQGIQLRNPVQPVSATQWQSFTTTRR